MASMYDRPALGLGTLLGALAFGCLGPNPLLDAGEDETATTSESGDGDGDGDGDGEGDGDGDGEGDGDGDGDSCTNNTHDDGETDLDCGGSCPPCDDGLMCGEGSDCASQVCDTGLCQAPTCSDTVLNGGELEVDCGGRSCPFCAHSPFIDEFDDFEGVQSYGPGVAMYENGDFVIMYPGLESGEFRLRWFDAEAVAYGPGVVLTEQLTGTIIATQRIVAGDVDSHTAYGVLNGRDAMDSNRDVFAITRGPAIDEDVVAIYQGPVDVDYADMALDGDVATFVWEQDGEIKLRRYNYATMQDVGAPLTANPDFAMRPARDPTLTQREGITYVAWVAWDAMTPYACDLEVRRFDDGWLEAGPISLGLVPANYRSPQIAVNSEQRVGLTWAESENGKAFLAAILSADLAVEGSAWVLLGTHPTGFWPTATDVVALDDDSFAFGWANRDASTVHVRRFTGPDTPLIPDIDNDVSLPALANPAWLRLSTAQNLVVVAFSGEKDHIYQIQGQVFSY